MLDEGHEHVDGKGHEQQHQAQRDALGELALAGLQGDGRGHGAGMVAHVAAQHHGDAHLGDDAAKSGQADHGDGEAHFAQAQPGQLQGPGAQGQQGLTAAGVEALHGLGHP